LLVTQEMMMKLYHCYNARSLRALWAIEELGLDCELVVLPFPPRVHQRSYLGENPLGTVPLLVDGETRMTESAAICDYLGQCYGAGDLVVSPCESGFGAYLNGLHQGEATLTFPLALVLRYRYFETTDRRQPQVVDDYSRWFLGRLRVLSELLKQEEFVAAGRFTMADISIGYALFLGQEIGLSSEYPSPLAVYLNRLTARPAFLRAQERQGSGSLF
jgi:glutathione S-transferase